MTRRIALIGYHLEVNAFSPVTTEAHFRSLCLAEGDALGDMIRAPVSALPVELPAFAVAMDALADWEAVPIAAMAATPGGPVEQRFYDGWLGGVRRRLAEAGPLDGVYIANHGAGAATADQDSDGTLYATVRAVVGPTVPIVATLDLHANISERMVDAVDVIIAYRTNPHVDQRERAGEAAAAMAALWQGMKPATAFIRLPICPPSVTLLTSEGPYADMIALGQALADKRILNVSVFGGFTFGDLPKNGMAVVVSARSDIAAARAVCRAIAEKGWAERHRHHRTLTPLDTAITDAVARGRDAAVPARLLADVADNPGGGGSGRTMGLLSGLVGAGAEGVILGVIHAPDVAAAAHALGVGARLVAEFKGGQGDEFAAPFSATATVVALHDGAITGRRGNRRGRLMPHGPSCLLDFGGVRAVLSSNRLQCYDPAQFEAFGLDIAAARTVVVKSRGHFRAGFDEFFTPDRIDEVDAPGLTSPVLSRFAFRHLPRPVYPLDPETTWTPPAW